MLDKIFKTRPPQSLKKKKRFFLKSKTKLSLRRLSTLLKSKKSKRR